MNQKIKLSLAQKEVLYGTLLGDGWLETTTHGATYRFGFKQKLVQQQYVDHVYNKLENLCGSYPINNGTDSQFKTLTLSCLRFYGHQFYGHHHKKKVPKLIHRWLTPRVLAYWFMDDGYKDKQTILLCTDGFEKKDVQRLCQALKRNYQLDCWLRKNRSNWRIYIASSTYDLFYCLVEPYILPSMMYKLPNAKKIIETNIIA